MHLVHQCGLVKLRILGNLIRQLTTIRTPFPVGVIFDRIGEFSILPECGKKGETKRTRRVVFATTVPEITVSRNILMGRRIRGPRLLGLFTFYYKYFDVSGLSSVENI
jgi:hypothetical protein